MSKATLVIMAAGIGSRFGGGIKQLAPIGPNGEIIMDYSIYDALEVLSTVRGSHRLVGIISHVAMLKENVPCAIEVKKSRRGSSLAIHG